MKRTGVRPGSKLELVLNVHSNEFWPTAAESEGVRVMVHESHVVPDPTQGFVVGKSMHAEVAVTMKKIKKLPFDSPGAYGWGNCDNDNPTATGRWQTGGRKISGYFAGMTSDECTNIHLAEAIVDQCGCRDEYLDAYFVNGAGGAPRAEESPASPASTARANIQECTAQANAPASWVPVSSNGQRILAAANGRTWTQNECRLNMHVNFVANFNASEMCILPCAEVEFSPRVSSVQWPVGTAADITKDLVSTAVVRNNVSVEELFGRLDCIKEDPAGTTSSSSIEDDPSADGESDNNSEEESGSDVDDDDDDDDAGSGLDDDGYAYSYYGYIGGGDYGEDGGLLTEAKVLEEFGLSAVSDVFGNPEAEHYLALTSNFHTSSGSSINADRYGVVPGFADPWAGFAGCESKKSACQLYPSTLLRHCAATCGCFKSDSSIKACNKAIFEDAYTREDPTDVLCYSGAYDDDGWYSGVGPLSAENQFTGATGAEQWIGPLIEHCQFVSQAAEVVAKKIQLGECRASADGSNPARGLECDLLEAALVELESANKAQKKIDNDLDTIEAAAGPDGLGSIGLLKLDIFYEHLNVETYTTSQKTTWSGVLSQLGGNFGLLLGFSVATMLEFVEFIVVHVFRKHRC